MIKVKAIIFDVDGVLINGKDEDGQYLWKRSIENDLGISIQQIKQFFKIYWSRIGAGELDTLIAVEEFLQTINSEVKAIDFISYWHNKDSNINKPILNLVEKLKQAGFDLYLGTNQEKYRAQYLWEGLNFKNYFNDMFASYKIGCEKPSLNYYNTVESELGLKSEQILFVDDTQKNIEAANSIGWQAMQHINNAETLRYFNKLFSNDF